MTNQGRPDGAELGKLRIPIAGPAAKSARDVIAIIGRAWSLSDDTIGDAKLAISELVTNVLNHAPGAPGSTFAIRVYRIGDTLTVEVHDSSPQVPRLRAGGDDDESGRGLILVSDVTDDCGHYLTPYGKVVWFAIKGHWPPAVRLVPELP
jgi:anti-sigma regulatory factor (Ser/Thr protein kinase)